MASRFFSIVIPTYNRANLIGKTLESLLNQEYFAYEMLVVDDGSTDNTAEVVQGFRDPRVRYLRAVHGERSVARNLGTRQARGEYVNYFDSDDLAHPNHLRTAAETAAALGSPELFHLGYDVRTPDGIRRRWTVDLPATANALLIDGNHLFTGAVFVRRDIARRFPFNENPLLTGSEDYELWLRLAARFPVHNIDVVTSTLVDHSGRSVLKVSREGLAVRMRALEEAVVNDAAFIEKYGRQLGRFRAYNDIYVALHLGIAGLSRREGARYLARAVLQEPGVVATRRFAAALEHVLLGR